MLASERILFMGYDPFGGGESLQQSLRASNKLPSLKGWPHFLQKLLSCLLFAPLNIKS